MIKKGISWKKIASDALIRQKSAEEKNRELSKNVDELIEEARKENEHQLEMSRKYSLSRSKNKKLQTQYDMQRVKLNTQLDEREKTIRTLRKLLATKKSQIEKMRRQESFAKKRLSELSDSLLIAKKQLEWSEKFHKTRAHAAILWIGNKIIVLRYRIKKWRKKSA